MELQAKQRLLAADASDILKKIKVVPDTELGEWFAELYNALDDDGSEGEDYQALLQVGPKKGGKFKVPPRFTDLVNEFMIAANRALGAAINAPKDKVKGDLFSLISLIIQFCSEASAERLNDAKLSMEDIVYTQRLTKTKVYEDSLIQQAKSLIEGDPKGILKKIKIAPNMGLARWFGDLSYSLEGIGGFKYDKLLLRGPTKKADSKVPPAQTELANELIAGATKALNAAIKTKEGDEELLQGYFHVLYLVIDILCDLSLKNPEGTRNSLRKLIDQHNMGNKFFKASTLKKANALIDKDKRPVVVAFNPCIVTLNKWVSLLPI